MRWYKVAGLLSRVDVDDVDDALDAADADAFNVSGAATQHTSKK